MKYEYGVSYNCIISDGAEIGGGGEGCTSLDYVGNNLDKIEQCVVREADYQASRHPSIKYRASRTHPFVGRECELGGEIVSVILEDSDDEELAYCLCVIFEDPTVPIVID